MYLLAYLLTFTILWLMYQCCCIGSVKDFYYNVTVKYLCLMQYDIG